MRNATISLLELSVAFSWLVEKQTIYHSRTSLEFSAAESPVVSFADKLVSRGRNLFRLAALPSRQRGKNSRRRPGQRPGNFSNRGTTPMRGSTSNTTVPRRTVNWVFPARAAASNVSHGVRFQPAKVCR